MLPVAEALDRVLSRTSVLKPETIPLLSSSLGQILAQPIPAAMDSPPCDKSLRDGFAVRSADLGKLPQQLEVIEEIAAGKLPRKVLGQGQAARIMTGAPIPEGADAVVMLERTESNGKTVTVLNELIRPGQYILRRGREIRAGDVVLPAGSVLRPQELGILAGLGKTTVSAFPRPRVSIISTGNELVEAASHPEPGQIRNSNGPMLEAQVVRAGAIPRYLGIAGDEEALLKSTILEGLQNADVLLLSGGVSVGDFDLVPKVLKDLGMTTHFHQVAMKPGKPLLFGTLESVLVFGLPGNPVSSFVSFELFVRPALRKLSGNPQPEWQVITVPVIEGFTTNNDRPTWLPARTELTSSGLRARRTESFGSADLRAMNKANSLFVIPAGIQTYAAEERIPVLLLDHGS